MIVVTGGAGFIGSNLLLALNEQGHSNLLVVDDLTDGKKFSNLADAAICDYQDHKEFLNNIQSGKAFTQNIKAVFHQGACSVTTEWDGRYMMQNNYEYSKVLFHYCVEYKIPFIYASSAAVYGKNQVFSEAADKQHPLNVYGYSKWLFDQYVLQHLSKVTSQVVGLRYFNVYGPYEAHKGPMASVAFHLMNQLCQGGVVRLFAGYDGYADGEQLRDFVYVKDVTKINLWFWQHANKSGIYNIGTGKARTFNDMARALLKQHGSGELQYIPFPDHLKGAYQSYTQADISKLREQGYTEPFTSLETGIAEYYRWRFS